MNRIRLVGCHGLSYAFRKVSLAGGCSTASRKAERQRGDIKRYQKTTKKKWRRVNSRTLMLNNSHFLINWGDDIYRNWEWARLNVWIRWYMLRTMAVRNGSGGLVNQRLNINTSQPHWESIWGKDKWHFKRLNQSSFWLSTVFRVSDFWGELTFPSIFWRPLFITSSSPDPVWKLREGVGCLLFFLVFAF